MLSGVVLQRMEVDVGGQTDLLGSVEVWVVIIATVGSLSRRQLAFTDSFAGQLLVLSRTRRYHFQCSIKRYKYSVVHTSDWTNVYR